MRKKLISIKKTIRVGILLTVSVLKSNFRLFSLSLILGLTAVYFAPQLISQFKMAKTPKIGVVGNYTISTLPLQLQKEISIGLTSLNSDGTATIGAAVKWELSPDEKTITFTLDKTLFWQDGTKFDSSQITYNLKGVQVKRKTLYSLEFQFDKPFAPLPAIVSQPLFKNGLIGLGENRMELIKFNGRFLSTMQLQNTQNGSRKIYKFFPTEQMAVNALKLGIINEVQQLHDSFGFSSDNHYLVSPQTSPSTQAVLFLNLRKPAFSEKTFRQSLAYALPDSFPNSEIAFSSLPQNSWVGTLSAKKYIQNIPLARSDSEKISSKSAKPTIVLSTTKDLQKTAHTVASSWKAIGIPVSVAIVDSSSENFDVFLTYINLLPDPDQYALWHSTQTGNISGYKSFKADRLLEEGRKTFDLQKRRVIYNDFEKALTEDLPAIFLYFPKLFTITRK